MSEGCLVLSVWLVLVRVEGVRPCVILQNPVVTPTWIWMTVPVCKVATQHVVMFMLTESRVALPLEHGRGDYVCEMLYPCLTTPLFPHTTSGLGTMQEPGLDLPAESPSELTHPPEKDIRHRNSPSHGQELTRSGKKDTTVTAHTRSHLAGLMQVGIATAVGAAAALVFQVIAAQHLGPADFGLLATFYAIVTVITYGSASLQNSVAVHAATTAATPTARRNTQTGARFARSLSTTPTDRRNTTAFRRRIPTAALTTGALGAVVLASMTPFLAPTLNVTPVVILATAIC